MSRSICFHCRFNLAVRPMQWHMKTRDQDWQLGSNCFLQCQAMHARYPDFDLFSAPDESVSLPSVDNNAGESLVHATCWEQIWFAIICKCTQVCETWRCIDEPCPKMQKRLKALQSAKDPKPKIVPNTTWPEPPKVSRKRNIKAVQAPATIPWKGARVKPEILSDWCGFGSISESVVTLGECCKKIVLGQIHSRLI